MKTTLIVIAGFMLASCAASEKVVEYSMKGAAYYCGLSETGRQALREQVTTSKGPVIQVNCENLE